MKNKNREQANAAANAGALQEAREYARLTGRVLKDWNASEDTIYTCSDEGCTWSGKRQDAMLIDDALYCPVCGGIL